MKVCISISATAALKAGLDDHGYKVVDVPAASLSPEQREELARHTYFNGKIEADFYVSDSPHRPVRATADEAIACIQSYIDDRARKAAEQAAAHEARVREWLDAPVGEFLRSDGTIKGFGDAPYYIPVDPRLSGRVAEAKRESEARQAAREAERKAAEDEKAAAVARLREWAESHGSDLLRARIADGFEWVGLAEAEWGEAALARLGYTEAGAPDGYEYEDAESRTTPTLKEIDARRVAMEALRDREIPGTVRLNWLTYIPASDEDGPFDDDREPIKRCELLLALASPSGRSREYFVLPGDVLATA